MEGMSDRYLCKAKRIYNGEWIEGYYIRTEQGDYIVSDGIVCGDNNTGLTDKNGKRWQGDIFEASDGEFIQRYFIQWNEYELQWYAECVTTPDDSIPLCEFRVEEIDVIGNIFDNPELLEGGAD